MKQWSGKVLCAARGCARLATVRLIPPQRTSGRELSLAITVRPMRRGSIGEECSVPVWLYGHDGLRPLLQRYRRRVVREVRA